MLDYSIMPWQYCFIVGTVSLHTHILLALASCALERNMRVDMSVPLIYTCVLAWWSMTGLDYSNTVAWSVFNKASQCRFGLIRFTHDCLTVASNSTKGSLPNLLVAITVTRYLSNVPTVDPMIAVRSTLTV